MALRLFVWLLFTQACLNFCMLKAGILAVTLLTLSYLSKGEHLLGEVFVLK